MTALVLREQNRVASAVSLKPLCLSEKRTKGSASSPNPSLALEEGRLDRTVLEKKEAMSKLVRVFHKHTHKATQSYPPWIAASSG